jgi:hypothetical protein
VGVLLELGLELENLSSFEVELTLEPLMHHVEIGLGRLVLTHLVEDLLELFLLSSDRLL